MRSPSLLIAMLIAVALTGCARERDAAATSASASPPAGNAASVSDLDQGPRAAGATADEQLAEQGEQLFKDKGCSACHTFGRKLTGPDLAGVSTRRTARWIESQILHPEKMTKEDPISRQLFAQFSLQMPNQGLTELQARAVVEYFKHRDAESEHDEKKGGGR